MLDNAVHEKFMGIALDKIDFACITTQNITLIFYSFQKNKIPTKGVELR